MVLVPRLVEPLPSLGTLPISARKRPNHFVPSTRVHPPRTFALGNNLRAKPAGNLLNPFITAGGLANNLVQIQTIEPELDQTCRRVQGNAVASPIRWSELNPNHSRSWIFQPHPQACTPNQAICDGIEDSQLKISSMNFRLPIHEKIEKAPCSVEILFKIVKAKVSRVHLIADKG